MLEESLKQLETLELVSGLALTLRWLEARIRSFKIVETFSLGSEEAITMSLMTGRPLQVR
jgi:hypothetical protein